MLWFAFEEKSFSFTHSFSFVSNQVCLAVLIITKNADIMQNYLISEVIMAIFF